MTEEFLHYIWKFRNYEFRELQAVTGEQLEILSPGAHNRDSGPDFFNARIRIDDTVWAGNVEIHIRASDWNRHAHHNDKAYDNIILHVVYESDASIRDTSGRLLLTLEMSGRVNHDQYRKYLDLRNSKDWIPCGTQVAGVNNLVLEAWLERLLISRLERKSEEIREIWKQCMHDWEEAFYIYLARNFGFHTNALPFELLARSLPYKLMSRYRDNLFQLEALFFGQAGLLEDYFEESYPQRLQNEYQFLAHKHKLKCLDKRIWKFLRMRPANFPTLRIAQFASLLHDTEHLFSKITEIPDLEELKTGLYTTPSEYWEEHYHFSKQVPAAEKQLGSGSINNMLINTVCPFLFVYGKEKGMDEAGERALEFLSLLPSEQNSIIREWKRLGLKIKDAGRAQALLELKNRFCAVRKCLDCGVGRSLLKIS
ncbi:MAG TPA: DUF2851 family protein [Bacteroidia bacterium]|jgi:hypothetical protein|nr:DUF2851 family protein [Bacteroidia bacterium]